MNRLLRFVARALESDEREVVLGDFAESGASGLRKLVELLGLIVRRHVLLWTHWQSWMALVGVACVSGAFLSRMLLALDSQVFMQMRTLERYGVSYGNGLSLAENAASILSLAVAIFCWTAVDVSVLRLLSRRTFRINLLAFWLACAFAAEVFMAMRMVDSGYAAPDRFRSFLGSLAGENLVIRLVVWLIPYCLGLTLRRNSGWLPTLTVAVTITAALLNIRESHALEIWSGGIFRNGPWLTPALPCLLAAWPVVFLLHNDKLKSNRA